MKYRKYNKYEKKERNAEILANALCGEGLYLYRNNTNGELTLPRPTRSGITKVDLGKEFQGDNYYMKLVQTGFLRLVKEIQSPAQEQAALEGAKVEEKLILDQPDIVTQEGQVEHVVKKTGLQKYHEERRRQKLLAQQQNEAKEEDPVLLNE